MSSLSPFKPLRLGTVGLGNWAGRIVDLLLKRRRAGDRDVELISVCEPKQAPHTQRMEYLRAAGVSVVCAFDQLLADESIEAVWLPVPIHLHRPFTEQALAAGKAVLVEKPAAGCVQDVDAMIAAQSRAKLPVLVSFQDTYDPKMLELKRAIVSGAIGEIKTATIVGCWPRSDAYYRRTTWAGLKQFDDTWVLDSPVSNAFAHYLHLAFFLVGESEYVWAQPESVEAELYRANDIENYDTASLRFECRSIPILALLTHACRQTIGPHIKITGDVGAVEIDLLRRVAHISNATGIRSIVLSEDARENTLAAFARHVRDIPSDSALSSLQSARAHVLAVNGASQAAAISAIPGDFVESIIDPDGDTCRSVRDLESILLSCADQNLMISESALRPWAKTAGRLSLARYTQFTGCPALSVFATSPPRIVRITPTAPQPLSELL